MDESMAHAWSKDLETGNAFIDGQHKALFAAMNNFAAAIRQGKGCAEIEKTLQFLMDYADQHFRDEEALQKLHRFPDFARHRSYHQEFRKTVKAFAARFQAEGPSEPLLHEIYVTVGDWLLHHIKSDDFVLAAYLRQPETV